MLVPEQSKLIPGHIPYARLLENTICTIRRKFCRHFECPEKLHTGHATQIRNVEDNHFLSANSNIAMMTVQLVLHYSHTSDDSFIQPYRRHEWNSNPMQDLFI